jgi:DNA-binding beta-propeller fold protein YncE
MPTVRIPNAVSFSRRAFLGLGAAALTAAAVPALPDLARAVPARRPRRSAPSGVIVLDDCDPDYKGKAAYEDNLSFFSAAGKLEARVSGLNVCEEIGSPHRIAVDVARQRVWVTETVGHRLLQFDLAGKQLRAIPNVQAYGVAVEPATGRVWVAGRTGRNPREAVRVFDQAGRELATHLLPCYDLVHDPRSNAFWMVERDLLKVSPAGEVLVRQKVAQWFAVSVAVNPKTGAVWLVTRKHPQVVSKNELLGFRNDGTLLHRVPLGDRTPFRVAVDARDGTVWVTDHGKAVLRFSAAGKLEAEHKLSALTAEVEAETGNLWVVTGTELLNVNRKGEVLLRARHRKSTTQAWIAAF